MGAPWRNQKSRAHVGIVVESWITRVVTALDNEKVCHTRCVFDFMKALESTPHKYDGMILLLARARQ